MKHYTKSTALNDVREPDEVVDEEYVERYVDAVDWFRNLGSTEKVTKHGDGTIVARSIRPDGKQTRLTVFTPIKE